MWEWGPDFCGVLDKPYPISLCLAEVLKEAGKTQWSALARAVVPPMSLGKMLSHHWRACEDDINPLGHDIGEDLRGDSPGVHGQA